jgi:hypothetical protein
MTGGGGGGVSLSIDGHLKALLETRKITLRQCLLGDVLHWEAGNRLTN